MNTLSSISWLLIQIIIVGVEIACFVLLAGALVLIIKNLWGLIIGGDV